MEIKKEEYTNNKKSRLQNAQITGIKLQAWSAEAEKNDWRFKKHIENDIRQQARAISPSANVRDIHITINGSSPSTHRIRNAITRPIQHADSTTDEIEVTEQSAVPRSASPTWVQPSGAGDRYVWPHAYRIM